MSQTEEVESVTEVDEIDYESFVDASMKTDSFEERQTGFATLTSCQVRDGEEEPLIDVTLVGENQQCYVFDATLGTGEEVQVLCSTNHYSADNMALRSWTQSSSVGEVAGEKVPVYKISENIYRIDGFEDGVHSFVPFSVIDFMMKNRLMKFENGYWGKTTTGKILLSFGISALFVVPFILLLSFGMFFLGIFYCIVLGVIMMYFSRENMIGITTRY